MRGKLSLKRNSGATLTWVAITMVVLLIIIAGILSMANFYHQKSVSGNARNQSYYAARSGINAVIAQLTADSEGNLAKSLKVLPSLKKYVDDTQLKPDAYLDLGEVAFDSSIQMGSCSLRLYHVNEQYYVKATGKQGGQSSVVVAQLGLKEDQDNPDPRWSDFVYAGDLGKNGWYNTNTKNTSLFIDDRYTNAPVSFWANGNNELMIGGNLYSHREIELSNESKSCTIEGTVSTDKDFEAKSKKDVYTFLKGFISSEDVELDGAIVVGDKTTQTGGDIIADEVELSGNVAVYGNITANDVKIKGTVTVYGDITANEVEIIDTAKIMGNVTAKEIVITGNAEIRGNVSAEHLTVETQDGRNGTKHIAGTTTAYQVNIANSKGVKTPIFEGVLTMTKLYIDDAVFQSEKDDYYPKDLMAVLCKATPVFQTVTYTGSVTLPEPQFPEVKQPSGVPETIPDNGKAEEITDGMALGGDHDAYYTYSKNNKIKKLILKGPGKVYLYVEPGCDLELKSVTYDSTFVRKHPTFYIIAKPGSTVTLNCAETEGFFGYVWGQTEDAAAKASADKGKPSADEEKISNVKVYCNVTGGIFAEGILSVDKDKDSTIMYISPSGDDIGGGGEETAKKTWYIKQYYNDIPGTKAGD